MNKIKIIGAGGIGSHLVEPLARYLSYAQEPTEITIIDGDSYEEKNRTRQRFSVLGNKAEVLAQDLQQKFPQIRFKAVTRYVSDENVISLIREHDVVFLCVDNHAARKIVSDRCEELDNITLINGGNDYTDGDVFIYDKCDGNDAKECNRTLTECFPEIKNAEMPEGLGCQEETENSPQLLFMNLTIAAFMCNCYYAFLQKEVDFERICLDIKTFRSRTKPEKWRE